MSFFFLRLHYDGGVVTSRLATITVIVQVNSDAALRCFSDKELLPWRARVGMGGGCPCSGSLPEGTSGPRPELCTHQLTDRPNFLLGGGSEKKQKKKQQLVIISRSTKMSLTTVVAVCLCRTWRIMSGLRCELDHGQKILVVTPPRIQEPTSLLMLE